MTLCVLAASLSVAWPAAVPPEIRSLEDVAGRAFELTNLERERHGLPPFQRDESLEQAAVSHARDMLARKFFDHESPDGETPSDRIHRIARRLICVEAENIWTGSGFDGSQTEFLARTIVASWMRSPGHRANILDRRFMRLGVGVAVEGKEVRAAQNFAEVFGLVAKDVPESMSAGHVVNLTVTAAKGGSPSQFDVSKNDRRVAGPFPLGAPARIDVGAGRYQLRFYFRVNSTHYALYPGPLITVTYDKR